MPWGRRRREHHHCHRCPFAGCVGSTGGQRRRRGQHRQGESPFRVISAGICFVSIIYCNSWGTRPAAQQLPAPGQSCQWDGMKLPCHLNPLQRHIQPRGRGNGAETIGSFIAAAAGPTAPSPHTRPHQNTARNRREASGAVACRMPPDTWHGPSSP